MAQWIVAKWVDENSCTVISSKDVTDKDFCTDKEITVVIRSKGQVELYQAKALFISDSKKEADKFSKDWLKKEEPQTSEEEDVSLHVGDHEFDNGAEDSKPAPPAPKGKTASLKRANPKPSDVMKDITNVEGRKSYEIWLKKLTPISQPVSKTKHHTCWRAKKQKILAAKTAAPKQNKRGKEKTAKKKEVPSEASKDAQKSAQEERIKAVLAARSLKMSQDSGSRPSQSSQLQSTYMQQQQHQQQHQQQQQQQDPFYSVQLPFQHLHPSMQSTHEFTPPPPSFNSTPPTSFSSFLQDARLTADDFDSFEALNLTSTPKVPAFNVPMESFQQLQEELCLLKTQVELIHDDVRQLKRKVKAQVNTVGPSVTCTSHSAAPGVGHGEGQPSSADSGMYNGFSKHALEEIAKCYSKPRDALKALLAKLFTEIELASSSIKGTNCNLQKGKERGALNQQSVAIIYCIMKEQFQAHQDAVNLMIRGQQKQFRKKLLSSTALQNC